MRVPPFIQHKRVKPGDDDGLGLLLLVCRHPDGSLFRGEKFGLRRLLDRHAPVDAILLRRIVAGGAVI